MNENRKRLQFSQIRGEVEKFFLKNQFLSRMDEFELGKFRLTLDTCLFFLFIMFLMIPLAVITSKMVFRLLIIFSIIVYTIPLMVLKMGKVYKTAAMVLCIDVMIFTSCGMIFAGGNISFTLFIWFFIIIIFSSLVLNFRITLVLILIFVSEVLTLAIFNILEVEFITPPVNEKPFLLGVIFSIVLGIAMLGRLLYTYKKNFALAVAKVKDARNKIAQSAHKAGQSDMAISMLHSIGNTLNNIMTSGEILRERLRKIRPQGLVQANEMLEQKVSNVGDLLHYYGAVAVFLEKEKKEGLRDIDRILGKSREITRIIQSQQSIITGNSFTERVFLVAMIEEAVTIEMSQLSRRSISVQKNYALDYEVGIEKTKLTFILINLLKNAMEALQGNPPENRIIKISLEEKDDLILLNISNNGPGIQQELREKIFQFGFTTKRGSYGWGLHICANYMAQMNGKLILDITKKETTFQLSFKKAVSINE